VCLPRCARVREPEHFEGLSRAAEMGSRGTCAAESSQRSTDGPVFSAGEGPGGERGEGVVCVVFKIRDQNTNADFNF